MHRGMTPITACSINACYNTTNDADITCNMSFAAAAAAVTAAAAAAYSYVVTLHHPLTWFMPGAPPYITTGLMPVWKLNLRVSS